MSDSAQNKRVLVRSCLILTRGKNRRKGEKSVTQAVGDSIQSRGNVPVSLIGWGAERERERTKKTFKKD